MRKYDIISTVFFAALGIYVIISGFRFGFGDWHEPGPGFIAVVSGALLLSLSALWLVMTLTKKWGMEAGKRFFKERDSSKKVLYTLLSLLGFTLLMNGLGFMIASLLFMVFLLKTVEPQRWRRTILLAFSTTILCVIVFQLWLQVQFPEGPLSIYAMMKWVR